jgi:hypothetical protein
MGTRASGNLRSRVEENGRPKRMSLEPDHMLTDRPKNEERTMRRLTIALLITMATFHGANAGFVNNYARWQALNKDAQNDYVSGLVDQIVYDSFTGEASYLTAWRQGIESCALGQRLTGATIAAAVTRQYTTYPADQRIPTAVVFDHVIQNICLSSINAERTKLGLAAWEADEGPVLGQ